MDPPQWVSPDFHPFPGQAKIALDRSSTTAGQAKPAMPSAPNGERAGDPAAPLAQNSPTGLANPERMQNQLLETRLQSIENKLSSLANAQPHNFHSSDTLHDGSTRATPHASSDRVPAPSERITPLPHDDVVDGMGTVSLRDSADEEEYFAQLFLLLERYLEGTPYSSLAWTFHSLSVKAAYQLGVHFTGPRHLTRVEREVRRRVWYLCAMNDCWLSATYGRPALIPLSHVKQEPSSHVPFSIVSADVTVSSLAFFDATMLALCPSIGDVHLTKPLVH
ncbi:unnamed protein product [Parascedosporium putredinis]|uniref:Xylanolytic transcriptional activator regulatory domain-containing protein n=1 Tax=Parascedosporium putredinis TaxID=1442378 RepID=A0A9P1GZE1_9PEZI|nr:unnamed protein product [Parascedosporium putredinis]CAI7991017.1 unnamed protein product [Parascedosporium putredinis]